jgi:phosphatidylglycerophosphatase A
MWRLGSSNVTDPSSDKRRLSEAAWEIGIRPDLDLRSVLAWPAVAIATVLGTGFFPIWPGTVGSALALPLVHFLQPLDPAAKGPLYLVLFLVCMWAAHSAGRQFGEPDHGAIICDETWGMAVVWECTPADFRWMLASFLVFRLFDTVKPWPISAIDRDMKNGLGVMLDDGFAAIAAILSIIAIRQVITGLG